MRQLTRLQEPEEPKILRRYSPIGADQLRVTYGASGPLLTEVRLPSSLGWGGGTRWVSLLEADDELASAERESEAIRLLARAPERLKREISRAELETLSPDELRILRLSVKEYSLLHPAPPNLQGEAQVPAAAGGQNPYLGAGEDVLVEDPLEEAVEAPLAPHLAEGGLRDRGALLRGAQGRGR